MNVHVVMQALSVVWAIVSFYLGGLGLVLAVTLAVTKSESALGLGGWRRILFNLVLIASGVAGLAWAFDPGHVVRDVVDSAVALILLAVGVGAILGVLSVLTRGRVGRTILANWWPRTRMPVRLAIASVALFVALRAQEAGVRAAFMVVVGVQGLLVVWELWLRWHFRHS